MNKKKVFYLIASGFGGGLIGFFANKLNTGIGIIMFTIGIFIMCVSIFRICEIKEGK